MAVRYREDESINFNPNLAAGQLQVGSAGAGGEALSQGLETFKPQTAETATILPQTTFTPIAGVGQATSNIFENIQKRFGPTGAAPRGDFETDIFRNLGPVEDDNIKDDEIEEEERALIEEFGLIDVSEYVEEYERTQGRDIRRGDPFFKDVEQFKINLDKIATLFGKDPARRPDFLEDEARRLGEGLETTGRSRITTTPSGGKSPTDSFLLTGPPQRSGVTTPNIFGPSGLGAISQRESDERFFAMKAAEEKAKAAETFQRNLERTKPQVDAIISPGPGASSGIPDSVPTFDTVENIDFSRAGIDSFGFNRGGNVSFMGMKK